MANSAPGYSGKPLADKLGIKAGMRVAVHHGPRELSRWLAPVPKGAALLDGRAKGVDIAMHFVVRRADLEREFARVLAQVNERGSYWVCWPKKSSGVETDIGEELLRTVVLPTGWVDVKVCAVSDTWSGLKFLRRTAK